MKIWEAHAPSRAGGGALAATNFCCKAPRPVKVRDDEGVIARTRGACAPQILRFIPRGNKTIGILIALLFAACRPDMENQPKAKPLSQSDFFSDQANARPIPPHTVERGGARENVAFYTGLTNSTYVTQLPVKLTPELLARGRERFNAMCSECHDRTGSGNGMVVLRGFPQPPSYHVPRLRNAPIGHFFDVITNGYGVMYLLRRPGRAGGPLGDRCVHPCSAAQSQHQRV